MSSDLPFWVCNQKFYRYFDQNDFHCRESQEIVSQYLDDWFFTSTDAVEFILPVVQFNDGATQFINGRHRTAVLLKYLAEVPLSFDLRFASQAEKDFLASMDLRPIAVGKLIELPDLPRVNSTKNT